MRFALGVLMWLQAIITADDLMHAFHELTPTRIRLDEEDPERWFELEPPTAVSFLVEEGALIRTCAKLQWDVLGIHVPITLRAIDAVLMPSIEKDADGNDVLALQAQLKALDLSALPGFVEDKLKDRINQALQRPSTFLRWRFIRTLDFHFHLPAAVEPARDLRLAARWGALKVSERGFVMAASFGFFARVPEELRDGQAL